MLEFSHVDAVIDATESEEVGVEHLLRDINDPSVSTLSGTIAHKMTALRGLKGSLEEMRSYLEDVVSGKVRRRRRRRKKRVFVWFDFCLVVLSHEFAIGLTLWCVFFFSFFFSFRVFLWKFFLSSKQTIKFCITFKVFLIYYPI